MRLPALLLAPVAALLAVPAPAAPAPGPAPLKGFAGATKAAVLQLRGELKAIDLELAADVKALLLDIKSGALFPKQAHDQAFGLLEQAQVQAQAALDGFAATVTEAGSSALQQLPPAIFPEPFVVGEGGVVDRAAREARSAVAAFLLAQGRFLGKAGQAIEKHFKFDFVLDRRAPFVPPMAPGRSGVVVPPPAPPFAIDLLLGGSNRLLQQDGTLWLGGSADPHGPGTVELTVTLPGVGQRVASAAVDPQSGRWAARFPPAGAGDLPEGNWVIEARLGGVRLSDSLGIH